MLLYKADDLIPFGYTNSDFQADNKKGNPLVDMPLLYLEALFRGEVSSNLLFQTPSWKYSMQQHPKRLKRRFNSASSFQNWMWCLICKELRIIRRASILRESITLLGILSRERDSGGVNSSREESCNKFIKPLAKKVLKRHLDVLAVKLVEQSCLFCRRGVSWDLCEKILPYYVIV